MPQWPVQQAQMVPPMPPHRPTSESVSSLLTDLDPGSNRFHEVLPQSSNPTPVRVPAREAVAPAGQVQAVPWGQATAEHPAPRAVVVATMGTTVVAQMCHTIQLIIIIISSIVLVC